MIHFDNINEDLPYLLFKREYENDGFKGTLEKTIEIKDILKTVLFKELEDLCLKHFEDEKSYYEQLKLVSELEYELLTLDNNHRKIKAEIAKKFIPSEDLKNLLTLKK